jgi:head-tail adaptor
LNSSSVWAQVELEKLAKRVVAEKAAKAAAAPATVTTKTSSTAKTVAEGVTVEDVDEAEEEEAGEEMTDNTPETRVKVSYATCSCAVVTPWVCKAIASSVWRAWIVKCTSVAL